MRPRTRKPRVRRLVSRSIVTGGEREEADGIPEIVDVQGGRKPATDAALDTAFEAFGVCMLIETTRPELAEATRSILPPGWRPCEPEAAEQRFTIFGDHRGTFGLMREGKGIARGVDLPLALEVLDSQVRLCLGEMSPDRIFVHAGVVGHRDRAIVLPGPSFAGKTVLVAALVRAGAAYYSDEFAVFDERGLVHPYPKPLSVRGDDLMQTSQQVESIGGRAGTAPLPVGGIVVTRYRPGAEWQPARRTAGEGTLAMLANAIPAQRRPAQALRTLNRAAAGAFVIEGERGPAEAIAPLLLAELER